MGSRNTNLDALRAVAILMVLGRHSHFSEYWHRIGWAGVDLFFVLSGFLVSGLLFRAYDTTGRLEIGRFYLRRGLKIWPAFYAFIGIPLLVDAVLPHHSVTVGHLLPDLIFIQNYIRGVPEMEHTWSLAVEEHFYLVLPLILALMIRNGKKPFAALPAVFAAFALFALGGRLIVGIIDRGQLDFVQSEFAYLFPTHFRIDALMFGVLLSYYRNYRPDIFQRIAASRAAWVLTGLAIVLLSTIPVEDRAMTTWGLTVVYLGAGIVVAKAVAFEARGFLRILSRALAPIGYYSYSIYLWHILFNFRFMRHLGASSAFVRCVCWVGGSILFGIVAARIIELPVLRLRDRYFPSAERPSKARAASMVAA